MCWDEQSEILQSSSSSNSVSIWEPRCIEQGLFIKPLRRRNSQAYDIAADDITSYPSSWSPETTRAVGFPPQKSTFKSNHVGCSSHRSCHKFRCSNYSAQTAHKVRNYGGYTPPDRSVKSEDGCEAYDPAQRLQVIEQISNPGQSQRDYSLKFCQANCRLVACPSHRKSPCHYCFCNGSESQVVQDEDEIEWANHDYVDVDGLPDQRESGYETITEKQAKEQAKEQAEEQAVDPSCDLSCERCLHSPQAGACQPEYNCSCSASVRQRPEDRQERAPCQESDQSAPDAKPSQDSARLPQVSESKILDQESRLSTLRSSSQLNRSGWLSSQEESVAASVAPPESVLEEKSTGESCDAAAATPAAPLTREPTSIYVVNQAYFQGVGMPQCAGQACQACPCPCCFHCLCSPSAFPKPNQNWNSQPHPETQLESEYLTPELKGGLSSKAVYKSDESARNFGEEQPVTRGSVRDQTQQCEFVNICPNCGIDIQEFLRKSLNTRRSVGSGSKWDRGRDKNSRKSRRRHSDCMNSLIMPKPGMYKAIAEESDRCRCGMCAAVLQRRKHKYGGTEHNFANRCKCNMMAAKANAGDPLVSHAVDELCNVDQIIDILQDKVSQLKGQRHVLKPFFVSSVVGQGQNAHNPAPGNRHAWQPNQLPVTAATYAPQPEQYVHLRPMNYHWDNQSNQAQNFSYIASHPYPPNGQYLQPFVCYGRCPAANELQFAQNPLANPDRMFHPAGYHVLNNSDYHVDAYQNYESVNPDDPGEKCFQRKQAGRVEAAAVCKKKRESSGFERVNLFQKANPYPDHLACRRQPNKPEGTSYYLIPNTENFPSRPPLKDNRECYPDFKSLSKAHPTQNLKVSPSILHNCSCTRSNSCQERKLQKMDSTISLRGEGKLPLKLNLSKGERNVQANARDKVSALKSHEEESNAVLSSSQLVVNNVPVGKQTNLLTSKSILSETKEEIIGSNKAAKGNENERSDLVASSGSKLTSGQNRLDEYPLKVAHSVTSVSKTQSKERNPMEISLAEKRKQLRSIKFDQDLIKPRTEIKVHESSQYRSSVKTKHSDIASMDHKRITQMKLKKNEVPIPPPKPVNNNR